MAWYNSQVATNWQRVWVSARWANREHLQRRILRVIASPRKSQATRCQALGQAAYTATHLTCSQSKFIRCRAWMSLQATLQACSTTRWPLVVRPPIVQVRAAILLQDWAGIVVKMEHLALWKTCTSRACLTYHWAIQSRQHKARLKMQPVWAQGLPLATTRLLVARQLLRRVAISEVGNWRGTSSSSGLANRQEAATCSIANNVVVLHRHKI